nr:MAG TPA: hypothetical protein [Caudoviricetes sp.]
MKSHGIAETRCLFLCAMKQCVKWIETPKTCKECNNYDAHWKKCKPKV